MGDQIANVAGAASIGDTPAASTDDDMLGQAFQKALLQGGMFIGQNLTSDTVESLNDSSNDPDAAS